MTQEKVDAFMIANAKMFPVQSIAMIRERLLQADDSKMYVLSSMSFKDPTTLLIVSILVGSLGIDRFILGDVGMGILKLITGGLCGILWIVDMIGIQDKAKEANLQMLMSML